jgi:hypothetical protein
MRKMQKVVLIFMGIFSMILASACGDQDKEAVEKIEQSLKEKYGEEFTVEKIGGGYGTVTTNTLKAIVSPKSAPEKDFDVEITKDLDKVWDKYMNVIMTEKLDMKARELASGVFGDQLIVKSSLSSKGLAFPDDEMNDKTIDVVDYLKQQTDLAAVVEVIIKRNTAIDSKEEAERVASFANKLEEIGTKSAYVDVYYVGEEQFVEHLKRDYKHTSEIVDYFADSAPSYTNLWVEIKDSNQNQTVAEIISNMRTK